MFRILDLQPGRKEVMCIMSNVKRGGWILMGMVLGALAASSMSAVQAQPNDPKRLTVTYTSTGFGQAAFIKDTKSVGCWFVVTQANAGVAMVTAPPEACSSF